MVELARSLVLIQPSDELKEIRGGGVEKSSEVRGGDELAAAR
jgi:hypothetical protein